MDKTKIAIRFSWFFIGLGVFILLYFSFNKQFNDGSGIINTTIANDFGSFIGGIIGPLFSLAAFLLVYATLIEQQKSFNLQKFEGRFFELLRYHRENVNLMQLRVPSQLDKQISGGRCFIEMKKQFDEIYEIVEKKAGVKLKEREKINFAFGILYYGVGIATLPSLREALKEIDNPLREDVIKECRKRKSRYDEKTVYFGGNQSRLGHYFRNLSQIVNYVDQAQILKDQEKYAYVKMLRTQFSQYEIAIFFYNSLNN